MPSNLPINELTQRVITRAIDADVTITDADVRSSIDLRDVAYNYVITYTGTNTFVLSLQSQYLTKLTLTDPQLRGALNQMVRDAKAQRTKPVFKVDLRSNTVTPAVPAVDPKPSTSSTPTEVTRRVPNGIYTVVLGDTDYVTMRLADVPERYNKPAHMQIASYLMGSDNESEYMGFAFVDHITDTAHVNNTSTFKKFQGNARLQNALGILLAGDTYLDAGKAYALASGKCFICNRTLTTPESIQHGIGPICATKIGYVPPTPATPAERVTPFKITNETPEQIKREIDELFPER